MLHAIPVDLLAKITLRIEQTDADHRHAQVTRGFELIAGDVAESARIDRQSFAQHVLHAEIGNAGERRIADGFAETSAAIRSPPILPA